MTLPEGKKYGVIVADPPWEYKVWSERGSGRSASQHYNVLETNAISKFKPFIDEIADKDCALFLWATYPNIIDAFDVMFDWGFTYKTVAFTWVKTTKITNVVGTPKPFKLYKDLYAERIFHEGVEIGFVDDDDVDVYERVDLRFPIGNGMWTRANPEIVLLGTRGRPARASKRVRNLILSTIGAHSEKPDEMFRRVEQLMECETRVELFARKTREGWDSWGDEVD